MCTRCCHSKSIGSGKTTTLKEFVEKFPDLTASLTEEVLAVWVYNHQKPDIKSSDRVEVLLIQGLPPVQDLLDLSIERQKKDKNSGRIIVVLDDCLTLFDGVSKGTIRDYSALITEYGRRGFILFFVSQVGGRAAQTNGQN